MSAATLHELFADNLPARSGKVFLIDPDREATYEQMDAYSAAIAAHLVSRDVSAGAVGRTGTG